jgi:hypothetical protein
MEILLSFLFDTVNAMNGPSFKRLSANATVVLVMIVILLVQLQVSYSLTFKSGENIFGPLVNSISLIFIVVRSVALSLVIVLWVLDRRASMFKWIVIATGLFTFGLIMNIINLCFQVIATFENNTTQIMFSDVLALMVTNVLIFSIWYWIIDPPGITEKKGEKESYDFLFPQRASDSPQFASWNPKYADYLFMAFTTSVAFSPTDTSPLTVRAKMLLMLQSSISLIIIVIILGNTINTLN